MTMTVAGRTSPSEKIVLPFWWRRGEVRRKDGRTIHEDGEGRGRLDDEERKDYILPFQFCTLGF